MPRFFFHVYDEAVTIDEVGVELPDVAAARAAALEGARAILGDELAGGHLDLSHRIEVEDAQRRPVLTLPFSAAVEIAGPVNKGSPCDNSKE